MADDQVRRSTQPPAMDQALVPAHDAGCPITSEVIHAYLKCLKMPEYAYGINERNRTLLSYTSNLNCFMAWLNYTGRHGCLHTEDLEAFRDWLSADHDCIILTESTSGWQYQIDGHRHIIRKSCAPSTVKQYMRTVSAMFAWLHSTGQYGSNIAQGIRTGRLLKGHRKESFEPEDIRNIYSTISTDNLSGKRMKAMFLLMATCGLRCIEISRMQYGDYEKRNDAAWVWVRGKGHSEADQKKFLPAEVDSVLWEYLNSRTDRLMPSSAMFAAIGNRSGGQAIDPATISRMIKAVLVNAGYISPRWTAHSLRYAAGNAALTVTGDNVYKAQHYLRHQSPVTTELYLIEKNGSKDDQVIASAVYGLYFGNSTDKGTD